MYTGQVHADLSLIFFLSFSHLPLFIFRLLIFLYSATIQSSLSRGHTTLPQRFALTSRSLQAYSLYDKVASMIKDKARDEVAFATRTDLSKSALHYATMMSHGHMDTCVTMQVRSTKEGIAWHRVSLRPYTKSAY